jgi:hypothetical protein
MDELSVQLVPPRHALKRRCCNDDIALDRREVKLIPDVSQALAWLEKHPQALQGIQRGLEMNCQSN